MRWFYEIYSCGYSVERVTHEIKHFAKRIIRDYFYMAFECKLRNNLDNPNFTKRFFSCRAKLPMATTLQRSLRSS